MPTFIGNAPVLKQLLAERTSGKPHHAYLFTGPAHVGKTTAARWFARTLLCTAEDNVPCGDCAHCLLIDAGNHPDFIELPDEDKLSISDVRDLKQDLQLKPHSANWRVGLVTNADRLGIPAQNAMLKLLEEPPQHVVLILTAPGPASLLPTTLSRCRQISFAIPSTEEVTEQLEDRGDDAAEAVRVAGRRPGLALRLLDDEEGLAQRREWDEWLKQIVTGTLPQRMQLAAQIASQEQLPEILEQWLTAHREALHGELSDPNNLSDLAQTLGKLYSEAQLRHNIKALFAARERLGYNPNVQLLLEHTVLTLGE